VTRRRATALCVVVVAALALSGQAATTKAPAGPKITYVVQRGDTLTSIAARFGTTTQAIATANGIRNRNVIVIGRPLTIPAGEGSSHLPGNLPAKLRAHPDRVALRPTFQKWAGQYGVPADLLQAVAWIESGWQTGVVSKTGAVGVGQLQPTTVDLVRRMLGTNLDPGSASDNIRMSARFLRYLLDRTSNNVNVALAAYYQGLRSVSTKPVLAETMLYVANVQAVRSSFV